jgi:hypothetical protein
MTFDLWELTHKLKITTMKKITMTIMAVLMLLAITPAQLKAGSKTNHSSPASHPAKPQTSATASRLDEIKSVDKSKLSASEKKELKKELRSIKSELNTTSGGGIYLSVGAIIIIILLLILLL